MIVNEISWKLPAGLTKLLFVFTLVVGFTLGMAINAEAGCGVELEGDCTISWARDNGDGSCSGNCGGCFYVLCI